MPLTDINTSAARRPLPRPWCTLPLLLFSTASQAHVKWFVPLEERTATDFIWYNLSEGAVQVWLGIAALLIGLSLYLDHLLPSLPKPSLQQRQWLERILQMALGLSLLLSASTGALIAPHYQGTGMYFQSLRVVALVVGCLLLTPWAWQASIALLALYLGIGLQVGWQILEYINIFGIALFFTLSQWPQPQQRAKWQPYALPLLRVLTGIALVNLGFAEKLARPDYAQNFVQTYMWNFMHNLGLESFTDRLFVLSAGMMEVVFGVILILGSTTRLNILAVSGFMLASNITFVVEGEYQEALIEIIGHLPIIATALLFVMLGAGDKWRIRLGGKATQTTIRPLI